jgi:hypothetical protein
MKKKLSILFSTLLLCFYQTSFSQNNSNLEANEFKTLHYYTFEGTASQDKINELEVSLLKIEFVSEVKVRYKSEKNSGQIVMVVKEKTINQEGDKSFSPTSIKQVILSSGLIPGEYTTGKYTNN